MYAQIPYEIDFTGTLEVIALSIAVGVFLGFLLSVFNMAGER